MHFPSSRVHGKKTQLLPTRDAQGVERDADQSLCRKMTGRNVTMGGDTGWRPGFGF